MKTGIVDAAQLSSKRSLRAEDYLAEPRQDKEPLFVQQVENDYTLRRGDDLHFFFEYPAEAQRLCDMLNSGAPELGEYLKMCGPGQHITAHRVIREVLRAVLKTVFRQTELSDRDLEMAVSCFTVDT